MRALLVCDLSTDEADPESAGYPAVHRLEDLLARRPTAKGPYQRRCLDGEPPRIGLSEAEHASLELDIA